MTQRITYTYNSRMEKVMKAIFGNDAFEKAFSTEDFEANRCTHQFSFMQTSMIEHSVENF